MLEGLRVWLWLWLWGPRFLLLNGAETHAPPTAVCAIWRPSGPAAHSGQPAFRAPLQPGLALPRWICDF